MAVLTLDDLKHRLQELKTLHASGALSAEAYASARAPLERQLVEQVLAQGGPAAAPRAPRKLVAAVAAFVVVVGVGGYLWKGQPQAWDVGPGSATAAADASAADGGSQEMTPQQLAQLTERLAKRLQQEPDNADGWVMLARSYALLSRYGDALAAYQRYTALRPGDAQAFDLQLAQQGGFIAFAGEAHGRHADQPQASARGALLQPRGDEALDEFAGGLRALVHVAAGEQRPAYRLAHQLRAVRQAGGAQQVLEQQIGRVAAGQRFAGG